MATSTLILGESGTGKSTSLRNLPMDSTFIISVIDKPLPFKNKYKPILNGVGNMYQTADYRKIIKTIGYVSQERPDIKTLIIDDFQYVMAKEYMDRATERGFDKFTELAQHVWLIIQATRNCRADLNIYFLTHSDQDANGKYKIKTIGKLLDEKITLEGLFTIVLHALLIDGQHLFLTQNDGIHIAKSPINMFEEKLIANDLNEVNNKINTYYDEDINE